MSSSVTKSATPSHESRQKQFKNLSKHEEMRRRRTEGSLELRKQKKEDGMMKRRNLGSEADTEPSSELDSECDLQDSASNNGLGSGDSQIDVKDKAPNQLTVAECVELLNGHPTEDIILKATEGIRRILSRSKNPPVKQVIDQQLVPVLVQIMHMPNTTLQFEAAWALTNIVSGTADETAVVVQSDAIPALVQLMLSPKIQVAEQATWALGNIIGDCAHFRDLVIQAGGVHALVQLMTKLNEYTKEFVRTMAWAFSNLCRHKDPHAPLEVLSVLAPYVVALLQYDDRTVQIDACWATSYLTDGSDDQIQIALDNNAAHYLMGFVTSQDAALIAPAVRALGNMVTGTDEQTQTVIQVGILPSVAHVMNSAQSPNLLKESCWLLSNVLAGTRDQIQACIDANLVPLFITCLNTDSKTQLEASWCIANMCQGASHDQMEVLIAADVITSCCAHLESANAKFLQNMMDSLNAVISAGIALGRRDDILLAVEECGGLDKLENLQQHQNEQVYQKALQMIEAYFNDDDDEENDENAQPMDGEVPKGGFDF
jgi:importin subunit alpha-2